MYFIGHLVFFAQSFHHKKSVSFLFPFLLIITKDAGYGHVFLSSTRYNVNRIFVEIQIVILLYLSFTNSINTSSCAIRNMSGITIAHCNLSNRSSRQPSNPQDIFIHQRAKLLCISDSVNNRIQVFSLD